MKDLDALNVVMFGAMLAWLSLMGWILYESTR